MRSNNRGTSAKRHATGKINIRKERLQNIDNLTAEKQVKQIIYNEMLQDVIEAASNPRLSYEGRYAILHNVTWNWTQHDGIFEGNTLWSKEAYNKYMSIFGGKHSSTDLPLGVSFSKHLGITEDHVVTRNVLIDHIIHNPYKEQSRLVFSNDEIKENIEDFLHSYLFSCVVTTMENNKLNIQLKDNMPDEFYDKNNQEYYRNPWARYIAKGIDVYRVSWTLSKSGNSKVWELSSDEKVLDLSHYKHYYL